MNLTLIVSEEPKLSRWVAQSIIEKQRREHPEVRVAFFFFQRVPDDQIVFANRDLHWVSALDPEGAKAASYALAHSLTHNHDMTKILDAFEVLGCPVIMCVPSHEFSFGTPTTIIEIT